MAEIDVAVASLLVAYVWQEMETLHPGLLDQALIDPS